MTENPGISGKNRFLEGGKSMEINLLMKILNSRVARDQKSLDFNKNRFFEGGNSMKINFLVKNYYKGIYFCLKSSKIYISNGVLDHFLAGGWPWIVLHIP